jgi:hypothetical protein
MGLKATGEILIDELTEDEVKRVDQRLLRKSSNVERLPKCVLDPRLQGMFD